MPRYNFSEISDFEFEELSRDLLQAELGVSLELFAPGRDQGIDIRHVGDRRNGRYAIVGQCKRWAPNAYAALLRHLKKEELPKIRKLAPERYILMTSVELNPHRKSEIVNALAPWVRSPDDIIGRDDLTGLLGRHPEVERRHIKLWLTSGEVLDALLNSDITNRTEYAVEQAKRQLRLWVPNESFTRARDIIDTNRVCIISGPPGIGKSMLADVLFAGYVERGYLPVVISEDIKDGERAWRSDSPQIFLYDDFLGRVTYGELHLRKNEPSDIAKFLRRVGESENKKFILTTREYILSEAARRYEHFSATSVERFKNVVQLKDYTERIRARILYNHLYFSALPQSLKVALLPDKKYWDVIRHPNYNPRVIEHVVGLLDVTNLIPDQFAGKFIATLDNPTDIWENIFDNLSPMARRVLLAVGSLPTRPLIRDVLDVVKNIWPTEFDPGEFMGALRTLEGTFLDIDQVDHETSAQERLVFIRDPSVRDYLWGRFEKIAGEAETMLQGAIFFEQCVVLYEGQNHANSMIARHLRRTTDGQRARVVVDHEKVATGAPSS